MIAGDAAATDPVCSLAPTHSLVEQKLAVVNSRADHDQMLMASPIEQWQFRMYRAQPK
ncbi:MAG: hypothetical protein JWQ42_2412 [Edaphobacter sp.]|nr:hypothetical protein [Edaphobacter sp.]